MVTPTVPADIATKGHEFYEALVRQALRELRGRSTQKKMSERLVGAQSRWHKWESGQKTLAWSDLRKIAAAFQIDLDPAIEATSRPGTSIRSSGGSFVRQILLKYEGLSAREAAVRLGISSAKLHRILSGKSDVSVAFVFQCLDEFSSTLPYFMNALVKNFSGLDARAKSELVSNEASDPWLSAIEAFLETEEYMSLKIHRDQFIAGRLGIAIEDVRRGLSVLLESGLIVKIGSKFKLQVKRVDLETSIGDSARFARFWTEMSLRRYDTFDSVPAPRRGWSSRVFPVSEEAREEIRGLQVEYLRQMARVIAGDRTRKKSRVQVFIHHYFDHHEFRELMNKVAITQK